MPRNVNMSINHSGKDCQATHVINVSGRRSLCRTDTFDLSLADHDIDVMLDSAFSIKNCGRPENCGVVLRRGNAASKQYCQNGCNQCFHAMNVYQINRHFSKILRFAEVQLTSAITTKMVLNPG